MLINNSRSSIRILRGMTYPKIGTITSWSKAKELEAPRLITFDAYNTLYCTSLPVMEQYSLVASNYDIQVQPEELIKRFPSIFKDLNQQYPNYGKHKNITADAWWSMLIERLFKPHRVNESMIRDILERFEGGKAYTVYPDIIEFIHSIKLKYPDVILGIISNTDPTVYKLLKNLGILEYFENNIYLSYDLEFSKPDQEIFDYAANDVFNSQTKASPKITGGIDEFKRACWHIGDEMQKDMIGAKNAGWNTILVDRLNRNGYIKNNNLDVRADMNEHSLAIDKIDQHEKFVWEACKDLKDIVQLDEGIYVVPNIRVVTTMFTGCS